MILTYAEQDYLRFDPCAGSDQDVDIKCRTVKLVRARKEYPCVLGQSRDGDGHTIKSGDTYRNERALIDGDYWGTYRACITCMDKWLADIGRPTCTER